MAETVQILVNRKDGQELINLAGDHEKKSLYVTVTNLEDVLKEIFSWQVKSHSLLEEILLELQKMNTLLDTH